MQQNKSLNLLLVDDHSVVRMGVSDLIKQKIDTVDEIGEAASGAEALRMAQEKLWALVILDISLPDMTGMDVLKKLREMHPEQAVLMFSSHEEGMFALSCIRGGAVGYITKDAEPAHIIEAIRHTIGGGYWISKALQGQLVAGKTEPHEQLTPREYEVMIGISRGFQLTEIGQKLGLSVKTISTHRIKILQKLNLETNAELTKYVMVKKLDKGISEVCSGQSGR